MSQRILEAILSLGFAKWLWDGCWFVWRRLYRERVTADIYVAFHSPNAEGELEKCTFLVVRNGTDKAVIVDMFIWESRVWFRYVRRRKMHKMIPQKTIVHVPAHGAMQQVFIYQPGNLFYPETNYFGLRLSTGKTVWIKTRNWRRAFREFKKDFPDWERHHRPALPLKFKRYGDRAS